MPISTIIKLAPLGTYETENGLFHRFYVTFEDEQYGEVSAKSDAPWYKVGVQASYQVTGNYKGIPKLKLGKPEFEGKPFGASRGGGNSPAKTYSAPIQPQSSSGGSADGPIWGMCYKMAVELWMNNGGKTLDLVAKAKIKADTHAFHALHNDLSNIVAIPREAIANDSDDQVPF